MIKENKKEYGEQSDNNKSVKCRGLLSYDLEHFHWI